MAGALTMDDQNSNDMQEAMMAQMHSNMGGGALSNPPEAMDMQGQSAASPQEMRDLQLLAEIKGLNTGNHNGSSSSQYGEVAGNELGVATEAMKQNALMRSRLAQIQANKSAAIRIAEENIQGRTDVAHVMAGKNAERLLSDDELKEAGLPPGTSAAVNNFGKIRVIHSPPASQQQLTGFGTDGKPQYADPGAALTPAMRTSVQTYLRQANQVTPQLNTLIGDLEGGKSGSSMGVTGMGERALEGTAGQVAGMFGRTKPLFPKDADLRTRMEQFNELATPALEADPRHQAMGADAKEHIAKMLPNPDSWHTDVGTSLTQLKALRDQMTARSSEYNAMLRGQGLTNNTPADTGLSSSPNLPPSARGLATPANPEQAQAAVIRQHAQDAISRGADPAAVAKQAKDKFGIDISGGQ